MAFTRNNIGRDGSAVLQVNGSTLNLQKITSITVTPRYATTNSNPLSEPPSELYIPNGWDLSFNFDRWSTDADDLATQMDVSFWSTGTLYTGSITVTINNPDGTTTTTLYSGASFRFTALGTYSGDSTVSGTLAAFAGKRTEG